MLETKPSTTAMVVSFARGVSGGALGRVRDPFADVLLPAWPARLLRFARLAVRGRQWLERALSMALVEIVHHLGLRTAAIDAVVVEAMRQGVRQVVILGAGLDARAYRMAELADATVFEVDHPATQAWKRRRAAALTPTAKRVSYVQVDFTRDSLEARLGAEGFDPTARTLWIWEGVTAYLPRAATCATLETIAKLSTPDSTVAMTYAAPRDPPISAWIRVPVQKLLSFVSEPNVGGIPTHELGPLLEERGFELVEDTDSSTWRVRFAITEHPRLELRERLAVARRVADARA